MRNSIKIFSILLLLIVSQLILAQQKVTVDYTSDYTYMIKKGDTSVMKLVGNVYFYHNNAVISCDTAYYYYQSNKFEGIGNVIINQDSLNVYGNRVTYDKNLNEARVLDHIVKIVDSTTTMYTRNLLYNTETSIAEYYGGATVESKDNVLESSRGFYDTNKKLVKLRENVAVKNPEYLAKTDSMDFYLDSEILVFECRTYIWHKNGDYLQADRGRYLSAQKLYQCEENSYMMNPEQELWADSISYYSLIEQVIMRSNIQILDTAKSVIAFGDYGQYWRESENVLLTNNPSVLTYLEEEKDTTFMRSDTLFMTPFLSKIADTISLVDDSVKNIMDQQEKDIAIDSTLANKFSNLLNNGINVRGDIDSTALPVLDSVQNAQDTLLMDSLKTDSIVVDSVVDIDKMTKEQYRQYKKREREKRKFARQERFLQWLRDGGMEVVIDTVKTDSLAENKLGDKSGSSSDSTKGDIIELKNKADSNDYIIRGFNNTKVFKKEVQMVCDSIISESVDSTTTFIGKPIVWNENNQVTAARIRAYVLNGEIYRSRLFNQPILAQEVSEGLFNQIKGDYMDAMFRNNEIYRLYVNDASEALYYKQQETSSKNSEIEGLIYATSENMIVDFDSLTLSTIKFFNDIKTITYPINKVPESQIRQLNGFEWQPQLRPVKSDVFDRSIRNSYRKEASMIEKPTMFITNAIDNQKRLLKDAGSWRDRTELIPDEKKYYKPTF